MSLPATSYPSSTPPATTQLAAGAPNAANSQAPTQPLAASPTISPQDMLNMSTQQVGQQATDYYTQLAKLETPQNRASYVSNSDIPGLKTNYNDLAQQLFQYDKSIASSNYQPITPNTGDTMPTDQSPLAMTLDQLNAPNFNFTNPSYAIDTQTAQKNNLNDLLTTLNSSIQKEFTARKGEYASTVASQKSLAEGLMAMFGTKTQQDTQLKIHEEDMANALKLAAMNNANARITAGITQGEIDPATGLPWNDANGNSPQSWADAVMSGKSKWADVPVGIQPAVQKRITAMGTTVSKITDTYHALDTSLAAVDAILPKWQAMNPTERILGQLPGIKNNGTAATPILTEIDSNFMNNILPGFKTAIGGRLTNQEIQWFRSQLPGAGDDANTAQAKINNIKLQMQSKIYNPNYVVGTSTSPTTNGAPSATTSGGFTIKEVK